MLSLGKHWVFFHNQNFMMLYFIKLLNTIYIDMTFSCGELNEKEETSQEIEAGMK